jgi:hypothetical protein
VSISLAVHRWPLTPFRTAGFRSSYSSHSGANCLPDRNSNPLFRSHLVCNIWLRSACYLLASCRLSVFSAPCSAPYFVYKDGQRLRGSGLVLAETVTKGTRHISIPRETSADELVTDQRTTKQGRHRPNTTHNVGISKSNAAPTSTARHTTGSAGKSAYNEVPKRSTRSRHATTGGPEEPKRRFKPSQKLLKSRQYMIDSQGVKPRSRYP